jgi:DNA polymerase-3 subunit delta'
MMKIREIIGHTEQQDQLQNDIEFDNISHAYLFAGPSHLGKMSLALQFAYKLLAIDAEGEAKKDIKTAVEKRTHPDLYVLDKLWMEGTMEDWNTISKYSNVPQSHRAKKPGAKTDSISIDDVRALHSRLVETGTGRYRVCIIRSMERMQDAAANAFLKILEEPPEGLVFILTTQAKESLLPTIISRTRLMSFGRVGAKDLTVFLDGVSEDDQRFILHIARGAPGEVVTLRDDPDTLREHKTVHGSARIFWQEQSLARKLAMLKSLHTRGAEADQMLLHLGITLREQDADECVRHAPAYQKFVDGLHTNAHRQLLTQRFAMETR